MACASAVIAPNPHQNDPYSTPSMNRSISTPDLIAALANLSKRSLQSSILTNLDAADVLSASQRHSSLNSSAENEASLSMERTTSRDSRNSRTSRNELTVPNEEPAHHQMQQTSNGSLISFGNVQLMNNSNNLADDYERRVSLQSDTRRNLLSLQTVGRTLRQTHNQLKRTRLLHVFYFLALPIYTIIGATIFKSLDGQHDDQQMALFRMRCLTDREERLRAMESICNDSSAECFRRFRELLSSVDRCYREWHDKNHTITHPMSDWTNALVYAFSVYTSIGYGTVSASTVSARVATVIYAALGIPLFFAFIKEEGNQCRILFVQIYNHAKRWKRRNFQRCCWKGSNCKHHSGDETESLTKHNNVSALLEVGAAARPPFFPTQSTAAAHDPTWISSSDQKKIFCASIILFFIYLVLVSFIFSFMTGWGYFTAFYFTFSSVALIGFGDVFPKKATTILANMIFIVIGVILFSMCYFILQEEIRVKAFEASRKARMSISKYSHSLMLHTRATWSRRNSPAFDQNEAASSNNSSKKFERNRKRRQSAPAIHVQKMDL